MPKKYFDGLPKFNGNSVVIIEDHIQAVWNYMQAYGVEEEDIFMRALMSSLEEETRRWFDRLSTSSINGYDAFTKRIIEGKSSF